MDEGKFDRLAKRVGADRSRRGVLKTLLGAALGAGAGVIGLDRADAAFRKRGLGALCSKNADCLSNLCLPTDRNGRRHCGCGPVGAACDDGNACTANDICRADGSCAGTPVECIILNECYTSGPCDPASGCPAPVFHEGARCNGGRGVCHVNACVTATTTTSRPTTTTSRPTTTSTTTSTTQAPGFTTTSFSASSANAARRLSFDRGHDDLAAFAKAAAEVSARLRQTSG